VPGQITDDELICQADEKNTATRVLLSEGKSATVRELLLRTKFKVSEGDADLAGALLKDFALLVTPRVVLDVIAKDPDDNHVLACAVAGKADFIVTGDKHLLNLSSLKVSKS
jgi:putative PIN family toxin of toxin-antitoxin system